MEQFFDDLFGEAISPECRLAIFTAHDRRTLFLSDSAQAATYARQCSATHDVYFGVGLVRGSPRGRGRHDDIGAIGALWADIDLAAPFRTDKSLPANVDEAISLLRELPLSPSILVHSGYGLHAYWPLHEPFVFASDRDRDVAAQLAKRWHGTVCRAARRRQWTLENLGDLTRVLRPPGTFNHKLSGQPVEVRILERNATRRYELDDFERYLIDIPTPEVVVTSNLVLSADAEPPDEKLLSAVAESSLFWKTWNRQRDDLPDPSPSGCDLSLATIAALRGWTDQEIANLLIAFRRRHRENPDKALRADYMQRTLARARSAAVDKSGSAAVDLSALMKPSLISPVIDDEHEELDAETLPLDPGPFPTHLLTVPGFISEVMEYTLATAFRRQPVLALGAAIALQGTLAGRKVRDDVNTRTNVYCLGVCPSGQGKERPREVNKEILYRAGLQRLAGPEGLASHAGLVAAVELQPGILLQLDEIGRLLKTLGDASRSPHLYHVVTVLMKLYTSSGTVYLGDGYADTKRNKSIDQPCACIWGTSVPKSLYEGLTQESITDGFVSRMLTFEGEDHIPKKRPATQELPAAVVETARWWGEFQHGGNLHREHPDPVVVSTTVEAEGLFEQLDRFSDEQGRAIGEPLGTLWSRTAEKARKLALIYACSANHTLPCIDMDAAMWGCALSDYLTRRMIYLAHQWVSESPFDAKRKRVLRIIRGAGSEGITRTSLCRATRAIPARERNEIIEALCVCGDIDLVSESTKGAPRIRFVAR